MKAPELRKIVDTTVMKTSDIQIGDFLEITAWNAVGMVTAKKPAMYGDDSAVRVQLEMDPDGGKIEEFQIEDGQFNNLYQ